ncbi:N-acetylmuramoyl-L-alanine amidase [Ruminiclostridium sufflavum DSM 19573]|uniref:N-acetylmuramoyl-L-alanine amidase n=1 Tax=Ruminiclostridium sufflavum DSM 19573 TaxID=1121337 RepID=A0A318XML8_9FIRM|nr:N-acetylmuramoyl-L-alanine amidase [Ruminiclostridium sufflavum]PYG87996.1 N-acetylmuramoyl-L-alanine amidase [Ruminiclostridium sufflavum DSM 19573]
MIVVIKKKNVLFVSLLLLFSITVFSIGFAVDYSKPVTGAAEQAPVNPQPVTKTVILDAGHGGEDPGAVSDYSGLKEKDVNLNIVMLVKNLLEKDNYKVILTRDADQLVYGTETNNILQKRREDLTRRKQIMDESGADIVVSIHLNKFAQTKYHGAQVFFPPNSPDSQKLANEIQNSIRLNVDNTNDRVALVKKDQIMILKNLKTTTVIVECGFLSNSEEEKKLAAEDYQNKIAQAVKGGIDTYFKGNTGKTVK